MKRYFLLLLTLCYVTTASGVSTQQEFSPSISIVEKGHVASDRVIFDVLSLQKSLIHCPEEITEDSSKTGFLLVPMTHQYVESLLEEKDAQIICFYLDRALLGYIILTTAKEFAELYEDPITGYFETSDDLSAIHAWLGDSSVGYIEQIGVKPGCSRMGMGSHLMDVAKILKPHGLIADVFVHPVKNQASLYFFLNQGFTSPGLLYQYPGANANFPYEHRTQVFFWKATCMDH